MLSLCLFLCLHFEIVLFCLFSSLSLESKIWNFSFRHNVHLFVTGTCFGFLVGATSICHFFCLSVCLSNHCAPYLRNHASYEHYFWYTCVKWWYLLEFFQFFKILIFWVVKRAKNSLKWNRNYISHASYLRNSVAYDFWYISLKWWHL